MVYEVKFEKNHKGVKLCPVSRKKSINSCIMQKIEQLDMFTVGWGVCATLNYCNISDQITKCVTYHTNI